MLIIIVVMALFIASIIMAVWRQFSAATYLVLAAIFLNVFLRSLPNL